MDITSDVSPALDLAPVLNEKKGYFTLEPEPTHLFRFTLQIIYAKNLSQVHSISVN
jgi:hypothetical protein